VIQRLFATGLILQAALPLAAAGALRSSIEGAIAQLDEIILQVRTTITALGATTVEPVAVDDQT
jgi:hypothetical protein